MTYRGVVKKGVVVLEKGKLKEGTRVRVTPIVHKQMKSKRRRHDRLRRVGLWAGPPGEFERLLAEVQRMREADMSS